MRQKKWYVTVIMLISPFVLISGCLEFKSIEQPSSALTGESFTVSIEATVEFGGGPVTCAPYFGICLPDGWVIQGDTISCTGGYNELIVYDPNLSLEQEAISPAPEGYYWWVGDGNEVLSPAFGTAYGEIQIQTDEHMGLFSIDYMLGNSDPFDGLNKERSNNHLIEVVDEYTPRELQAVNKGGSVFLSWIAPFVSEGLIGYNVYRDGQVINESLVVDTTFVDEHAPGGGCVFSYTVSSLYDTGDAHAIPYEVKVLVFSGGTGEPNDPYQVTTSEQLVSITDFSNLLDKSFILVNDIDLNPNLPGAGIFEQAVIPDFYGTFDGNGHTILHLTITGESYLGLFGELGPGAIISNLALEAVDVNGTGDYIGGLVGYNNGGSITNSYSNGSVNGVERVGGLVGYNRGSITTSYSTASVRGWGRVGGLVGENGGRQGTGSITNSYSTGSVSGVERVGGLVGYNDEGSITTSYSTGTVNGNYAVGGLVGWRDDSIVTSSFWDIQTSGQATSRGGTGKTTAEMQMESTFIGWGCEPNWTINEGTDYPRLAWQNMPGKTITAPSYYGTGSGTEVDPYLIYTAEELNMVGLFPCEWDKHFKLMADIDLSAYTGTQFNIIGIDSTFFFTGVFDGNGHTISNFSYTSTHKGYIGLFTCVDGPSAEIKNLGIIGPNIDAGTGHYIGSLVGCLTGGTITNCYIECGSVSGTKFVGGLVGYNSLGTITNCYATECYSTGTVSGDDDVGGLVGRNGGSIATSYSTGTVSGDTRVGGLVGHNYQGSITSSYSTGSVSGGSSVGGLVGYNYKGSITTSYSTGPVAGNERIGGLVGHNYEDKGSITSSFWDIQTSGQATSRGGTGKTTAEMQTASTFLDAGWDFVGEIENGTEDIWWIDEGKDYPRLWWELIPEN